MSRARGSVVFHDGSYLVSVSGGTDPLTRQRIRPQRRAQPCPSCRQPTEGCRGCLAMAEQLRTELLTDLDQRRTPKAPGQSTVESFLLGEHQWLDSHRNQIRTRTWGVYKHAIEKMIVPRVGHVRLRALDTQTINALYAALDRCRHWPACSGQCASGGYAQATVSKAHMILRSSLKDAVAWGLLEVNPAREANLPRHVEGGDEVVLERRVRAWTKDQLNTFLGHTEGSREYPFWFVAARTGMRRSELCGLKWDMVDLDTGHLRVSRSRLRDGGKDLWAQPKSANSRRTLALSTRQIEVLRSHRKTQVSERLAAGAGWQDNDLVFCAEDGTPEDPLTYTTRFRKLCRKHGLEEISLHGLRHTYATLLLEGGVPLAKVSKTLGHATTSFTNDVYGHLTRKITEEVANAADRLMEG